MKIQLLIAIVDGEYREHLSRVLRDKYSDAFEISICSNLELVRGLLGKKHYDVAILDPEMAEDATLRSAVQMPVLLWDGSAVLGRQSAGLKRIRKYQKISGIVSEMLELYAEVAGMGAGYGNRGSITVVWSPVGGCGKTTVALAYAAQRVAEGRKVVYLDMQNFSGSSAYFPQTGKSISSVFGKMDSNVAMLFQSIRLQDGDTGIYYFCQPENYDDIKEATGFNEYERIWRAADSIKSDLDARYKEFAKADAYLLYHALYVPTSMQTRAVRVTHVVPFTAIYSTGVSQYKYKGTQLQEGIVSVEQYNALKAAWEAGE